ncbi:MAG: glycosyltransferase [Patescibacteria group bacterium]
MKILIVVTRSEMGGAQVFALNLARGLKASGEEVFVAGGPGEFLPESLAAASIPFYRFKNLARSYNPFKIFKFLAELKAYVGAEKFDVVHLNSTNTLFGVWRLAALRPKVKIIFTVHGLSFLDANHHTNILLKSAYRLFFKSAWEKVERLVFVSRLNYASALKQGLTKKGEIIYNGLDQAAGYFSEPEAARAFLSEKSGIDLSTSYIYGSIGRLAYPKNYEFLINSHIEIKKLQPEAKLILIGEGPERAKYETLIKSYRLEKEVYLLGEIKDASRYLKAFDLFVLPSIFEGMSLSLMEAVVAGIPALASRVGGNEEIIGAENCFALDNQEEFLEKLKSVHMPKSEAKRFASEEMVEEYRRIYLH